MLCKCEHTLSAFTKVIFQVTEPDSRALGSLFLDVEERRRPINLAIDVLDKLERHPDSVVKEFAARYVWPLQAGAKDRIGHKRWWNFHTLGDTSPARVQGKEQPSTAGTPLIRRSRPLP